MNAFVVGVVLGIAFGVALVLVGRAPLEPCPDPDAHQLSDADRRSVAAEFAVHAEKVQAQLRHYADQLAGGDPELRERLRRLEGGGRP